MLLTQYENQGILHVALVSRGNESLAQELLDRQSDILTGLYGSGSSSDGFLNASLSDENGMSEAQTDSETEAQENSGRTDTETEYAEE